MYRSNVKKIITALAGLGIAATTVVGATPAQAATAVATAPTVVKGAPGNLAATIFWAPPINTGGTPITSYHPYAKRHLEGGQHDDPPVDLHQAAGWLDVQAVRLRVQRQGRSMNATVLVKVYAAITHYANCTALNEVYVHGVGRASTVVDHTTGVRVRNFYVSKDLYDLNTGNDRDKDGIACETA